MEYQAKLGKLSNRTHTAIQPWLGNQFSGDKQDTLGKSNKSWLYRKTYQEHLINYKTNEWKLSIDPLVDLQLGYGSHGLLMVNTRGFQFQGSLNNKFSFYTSFFGTQAFHPNYVNDRIQATTVVPGQGFARPYTSRGFDYKNAVAYLSYSPNKHFNFQFGHDRHFIGEGYRSLLLSDASFPHPFFRIVAQAGPIRYMYLLSQYSDLMAPQLAYTLGHRQKYSAIGYLDWQINRRLTLGFFQAVVWQADDSTGRRGIDPNYLNPIIFFTPVQFSLGSEGNLLLGLNAKFKLHDQHQLYGQFILDEFDLKQLQQQNGYWANKYGWQLGYKGVDLFGIPHLFFQSEWNVVRPFTYSHWTTLTNFGQYNEPLAHPLGANFKEWVSTLHYRYKRYYGLSQLMVADIGLDNAGTAYGQNIFSSYFVRNQDFGNEIGQGLRTRIVLPSLRLGYILNTQTNLRFELGLHYRHAVNNQGKKEEAWITVSLVNGLRNLYYNF